MSIILAQVSDTHLLTDTSALLRGSNPWQSMQAVLQQVSQFQPDGLLLTGDLADSGERAAYEHLRAAISPLGLPAYWLPGNHDDIEVMQDVLKAHPFYGLRAIELGSWRLLLLNSVLSQAKFGEGRLSLETLQWLKAELCRCSDKPTVVALHHHPVPINIDWVDQMQVQNASDLLRILDASPQVKLVVFGHIHLDFSHQRDGKATPTEYRPKGAPPLSFYGCPSTHLQLANESSAAARRPGFRLFYLYADGTHQTQVERLSVGDFT